VLCRGCRRLVSPNQLYCGVCGRPVAHGIVPPLDIVLRDGSRVALVGRLTIGRASDNGLRLDDQSVSRHHCVIEVDDGRTVIADAGSSHGTFVDGGRLAAPQALGDGSAVRLGEVELRVERRRDQSAAGRTMIVAPGRSIVLPAVGAAVAGDAPAPEARPRLRSGCALKRLEHTEGENRYVLRDLTGKKFLRIGEDDAALIPLLEGGRPISELIRRAQDRLGPAGPVKLAQLLAELGERGLLEGVDAPGVAGVARPGLLARLFRPRARTVAGAGAAFDRVYALGGFVLFTLAGRLALLGVGLAGLAAFADVLITRKATPFVVGGRVGLGALVFMLGRLAVAALHESAHGLTMAACGRRVQNAGIKLLLIFPYVFVDTSEAWLEPRRRRIAISLAGPACDLVLGGAFALACLGTTGSWREVFFQLSFGAYLGALFNLNPLLDRDGYHVLVDLLGEPGLRSRARARLAARLAARSVAPGESRALEIYAITSLVWLLGTAVFATLLLRRYEPVLVAVTHHRELVLIGLGLFTAVLFLPLVLTIGVPLTHRLRRDQE
jgi:putative peptide zinc metalloprotease protein